MGNNESTPLEYEYTLEYVLKEVFNWNTTLVAILPKISGALSAVGSSYVIQDVLRDPRKRNESTYHRVMLGLSTSDFLSSVFVNFLSTWPMPRGYMKYAVGTVGTCDAVGFLCVLTFLSTPFYNCSLATYFLVQLKYNWSDQRIKAIEKWFHIIPWSVGLAFSIPGLVMKAYGPASLVCTIAYPVYPFGCDSPESSTECQRGLSPRQVLIFFGIAVVIMFLCICYVLLIMFMVYRAVRDIENRAAQYSIAQYRPRQSSNNNNSNSHNSRSRRIMVQGILYSVILFVVHLPLSIAIFYEFSSGGRPDDDTRYVLEILSFTFFPAQGFFNVLVYLIPTFQRIIARQQRGNSNTGGGGCISMMGTRLARLRESMRAFIINSAMKRRNDDDDDERNPFQGNEHNVEEEKQKEEEKCDMTTDVKFPVREVPEVQGEMHEDSTMEMQVLGDNKLNPNDTAEKEK